MKILSGLFVGVVITFILTMAGCLALDTLFSLIRHVINHPIASSIIIALVYVTVLYEVHLMDAYEQRYNNQEERSSNDE